MSEQKTYQQVYEEFWKPIVETEGQLDKDKVMRELSDYRFLLQEVPKVYCHVSGGVISYPNTHAFEVNTRHDDQRTQDIEEAVKEALKDKRTELEALLKKYMALVGQEEGTDFLGLPQDVPRTVGNVLLSPEEQKELWRISNER
jgi:hypothetical protein